MTRVSFYTLGLGDEAAEQRFICRLIQKISAQHRVHVLCPDAATLDTLDRALWTFEPLSFVAHDRYRPEADAVSRDLPGARIRLARADVDEPSPTECEVLVNLASTLPGWFARFERLADIVVGAAAAVEAGRARYRFLQAHGYPLEHHPIRA